MHKKLQLNKLQGVDLKCDINFLISQTKNIQIEHFWFQIYAFLFSHKILYLYKLQGVEFKYGNSFLKIPAQKYLDKIFLVPSLGIVISARNFAIRQN